MRQEHPGYDRHSVPPPGDDEDDGHFAPTAGEVRSRAAPLLRWHGEADPHADRAWLVRDLIPEMGKGLTSGQWGTGKTFGALDLSACVMTGLPFANRRTERVGGVLFIAPEGAFEISIRLRGLTEHKLAQAAERGEIDAEAAARLVRLPFAWIEECPRLVDKGAAAELIAIAKAADARMQEAFGLPLALIVIDTVAAGAGFDDENSAAETQKVMDAMQALSRETTAFVMGVDHFGKASETGTRGSSAKEAAADVVLAFLGSRDDAGTVSNTRMALRKLRGGKVGMETAYTLDVVELGENYAREPITTCVVTWQEPRGAQMAAAVTERWPTSLKVLRSALETALLEHGQKLRPFSFNGPEVVAVIRDKARAEFAARYPADGDTAEQRAEAKRKAFGRALSTAVARELVTSREIGGVDHLWMRTADEPRS